MIVNRQSLGDVFIGILRPDRREIDHDQADAGAHAAVDRGAGGHVGKEIHVVEAGRSPAQHLGHGETAAVVDELLIDPARFRRPDMVVQPVIQRQIIRQPAQQGHGGMGMGVDQTRDQQMPVEVVFDGGRVGQARLIGRQDAEHPSFIDGEAVVLVDTVVRLYRYDPAGMNKGVDSLHADGEYSRGDRLEGVVAVTVSSIVPAARQ